MEVLKVEIQSWTASFRHPLFISSQQITLPIPPLSTIHGILSCICGEYVHPSSTQVGYFFKTKALFEDLETIYMLDEKGKGKANICHRQNFFEARLVLYLTNKDFARSFKKPYYPLTLGRSGDLAMVTSIKTTILERKKPIQYESTLLPFSIGQIGASVASLPRYFTNTIPRRPEGVEIFYLLEERKEIPVEGWVDPETQLGVYFHSFLPEIKLEVS